MKSIEITVKIPDGISPERFAELLGVEVGARMYVAGEKFIDDYFQKILRGTSTMEPVGLLNASQPAGKSADDILADINEAIDLLRNAPYKGPDLFGDILAGKGLPQRFNGFSCDAIRYMATPYMGAND